MQLTVEQWLGGDNQLGIDIWHRKYQNENESFDEWLERISGGNESVKTLIVNKRFLFGGRILANRGLARKDRKITYSNCYVTDTDDSIEDIFETAKKIARTFSYGGGIGVDISKLAPKGARVHNSAKESTGAVSFMDLYSAVTGLIGQNGRRGALMLSMACNHPDIEDFIDIKNDLSKVNYANISVRVDDMFMQAVENNEDYELSFTRKETGETISKTIRARELFHELAENNWKTGEPGILFWDTIERYNLLSDTEEFKYAGTNPCGEEPLPAGGSCLLGSMNLSEYVLNPFTENAQFDFDSFSHDVHVAVFALNEVLDEGLPLHPLQEQRDSVAKWRQIGLGIFGLADMLIKMNLCYGDSASLELCDNIGSTLANSALQQSAYMAETDGTYPAYSLGDVWHTSYFQSVSTAQTRKSVWQHGLRNSQLLTTAPTGTLSTMLGVSGGIEPIFANSYIRTTKSLHNADVEYKVYTPIVKQYMEMFNISREEDLPPQFVTAQEIDYRDRIEMQGTWQYYIDASISSTVNVPNDFTVEQIEDLYIRAWARGLKGVTVFRDGCERTAILNTEKKSNEEHVSTKKNTLQRGDVILVNDDVIGLKRKLVTGCGSLHCSAFFDPATGDLLETYISKGSTGGCLNSLTGLSRMISLAARAGVSIEDISDQLESTGVCPSYAVRRATHGDTSKGSCCPMAIGRALMDMYNEMQISLGCVEDEFEFDELPNMPKIKSITHPCPECGEQLMHEGGCDICKNCGYSHCG